MASALLGMKRLRQIMTQFKLSLGQAESELRHQTGLCQDCWTLPEGLSKVRIEWARAELGRPVDFGVMKWVEEVDGCGWVNDSDEALLRDILTTENERRKKRRSESNSHRHLWSWMVDESGEPGGKLLIATAFERSSLGTRAKRRRQLEEDSRTVLGALEMLNRDPLKVRRQTGAGASLQLAKLSLKQQDRQDEEKTGRELDLRSQLEKARAEVRRIQAEIRALIGTSGKTGK